MDAEKVTIIVVAKCADRQSLEQTCRDMIEFWFDADPEETIKAFVVPSDDLSEQIEKEYF